MQICANVLLCVPYSMPSARRPLSSVFSQASCNSSGVWFDLSVSLDLGLDEAIMDTIRSLSFDGAFDSQASRNPPIGLRSGGVIKFRVIRLVDWHQRVQHKLPFPQGLATTLWDRPARILEPSNGLQAWHC